MTDICLSFIIVNWNTRELTRQCLASIFNSVSVTFEVILVDNGSTDGSVEYLSREFKNLVIISNRENLGFAKANNQALGCARGQFAVLVNSDVVVNRLAVELLLNFLQQHKDVAVVGCRLIEGLTNRTQKFAFGYSPSLFRIFNQFSGLFNLSKQLSFLKGITSVPVEGGSPFSVDWVSGAYMMVRMQAYRQVGGLNEGFFFYIEDMEWCLRFRKYGWKIYYIPVASVIHFLGSSQKDKDCRVAMSCNWYRNLRSVFSCGQSQTGIFLFDLFAVIGFGSRYFVNKIMMVFGRKGSRFEAFSNLAISRIAFQMLLHRE